MTHQIYTQIKRHQAEHPDGLGLHPDLAWLYIGEKKHANGPADTTATLVMSCFIKIKNCSSFCCKLSEPALEKKPLNECS